MSEYIIKQIAAASVPNAPVGAFTLFLDTDGNWKKKDENGIVSLVAGVADKNLEQVLTVGNSTGNNDIIVQDNKVIKSSTGDTIMAFRSNTMTINAGSFATDVAVSNVSMNSLGTSMSLFKSDFSKIGFFQVIENSTGNQTTGTLPNYPVVSGSQNSTINQNVINTSINGGNNIIAKTNNTDYSNQNGYNTGTAGELIVNHTTNATTDRTQTHQDADGTIALLSDINAPGVDSVTGDGVDNTDPLNPVLTFPEASEVANAFDKSSDDASDINMASSSQTVQNKIVTIQNEVDLNTAKVSADGSINTHSDVDTSTATPQTGDYFVWDGNNWVPNSLENGFTIFPIWAEENGDLISNDRQWSFGNGSIGDLNIVLPSDCELYAVSFDAEFGSGASIDIMKNDSSLLTTKSFTGKDFETLSSAQQFSAGDCLGFRTNTPTGTVTDARVCAWFRIKSTSISTLLLNELLNVSVGSASNGEALIYNGSNWVNINPHPFYDRDIPGIYLANQTTVALANQQNNVYEQYGEGLTFTPVVTDNYSLGISWVWSSDIGNQSMDFRISVIEDSGTPTELLTAKYENKEFGGTGVVVDVIESNAINGSTNTGTDTRIPQTVHADFNLTSGVEYKWILEFLAEGTSPASLTIYNAQISIEQKTIRTT